MREVAAAHVDKAEVQEVELHEAQPQIGQLQLFTAGLIQHLEELVVRDSVHDQVPHIF